MFISAHTARTHVQRVIEKFEVHSQREVLALGLKHRLLTASKAAETSRRAAMIV